jgi:hypothetical protein
MMQRGPREDMDWMPAASKAPPNPAARYTEQGVNPILALRAMRSAMTPLPEPKQQRGPHPMEQFGIYAGNILLQQYAAAQKAGDPKALAEAANRIVNFGLGAVRGRPMDYQMSNQFSFDDDR